MLLLPPCFRCRPCGAMDQQPRLPAAAACGRRVVRHGQPVAGDPGPAPCGRHAAAHQRAAAQPDPGQYAFCRGLRAAAAFCRGAGHDAGRPQPERLEFSPAQILDGTWFAAEFACEVTRQPGRAARLARELFERGGPPDMQTVFCELQPDGSDQTRPGVEVQLQRIRRCGGGQPAVAEFRLGRAEEVRFGTSSTWHVDRKALHVRRTAPSGEMLFSGACDRRGACRRRVSRSAAAILFPAGRPSCHGARAAWASACTSWPGSGLAENRARSAAAACRAPARSGRPSGLMSALRACAAGDSRKLATTCAPFLGAGIDRNRQEVGVADRAGGELEAVDAVRQALGGDLVGGFVGVEGQREQQFAVGHHLAHRSGVLRELLACAPQVRMQRVQRRSTSGAVRWPGRRATVCTAPLAVGGRRFQQRLLHEGGAVELRRARIGDPARIAAGEVEQAGHVARRGGHAAAVRKEGQLGHAPGRFHALDRLREVHAGGRLAGHVHMAGRRAAFRQTGRTAGPRASS
jgi:hypothetical protein